jgi:hypothetical protein
MLQSLVQAQRDYSPQFGPLAKNPLFKSLPSTALEHLVQRFLLQAAADAMSRTTQLMKRTIQAAHRS